MTDIFKKDFGDWRVECVPDDGARIIALNFAGYDLLTAKPADFRPPVKFIGEFETRPVFGYDDCFPTVDPCIYPATGYECRDHGEICWQGWRVKTTGNDLICSVECLNPHVKFTRTLKFEGNRLTWRFEVLNLSDKKAYFLHVMHALLPPGNIRHLELPGCLQIVDEVNSEITGLKGGADLANHLLSIKPGEFEMLLLREVDKGSVKVGLDNGLFLNIEFDHSLFPTLGIWWNNKGYPAEEGLQRSECAFEPIPGTWSSLSKSFSDGGCLAADPGKTFSWEILWTLNKI